MSRNSNVFSEGPSTEKEMCCKTGMETRPGFIRKGVVIKKSWSPISEQVSFSDEGPLLKTLEYSEISHSS